MGKFKIISISIISILTAVMLAIDIWWLVILIAGPEKEIVNTFNVGMISTSEETGDEHYVLKVKYFSNENNNGYECLDVEFSGFTGVDGKQIYSQGFQIISTSLSNKIWYSSMTATSKFTDRKDLWHKDCYTYISKIKFFNSDVYYYSSGDDFEYDYKVSSTVEKNLLQDGVIITLGSGEDKEFYKFKFTGDIENKDKYYNNDNINWFYGEEKHYYNRYDLMTLASCLFDSAKGSANGTSTNSLLSLDKDLFQWSKFDGKTFVDISTDELTNDQVITTNRNFFAIQFERSADGLRKSTDSIFNMAQGKSSLNLTGDDIVVEDYLYGKTLIIVNNDDFDYLRVKDNFITLKLKESFIKKNEKQKDNIVISVQIDLDKIESEDYVFLGFEDNSGLNEFTIYESYTISNGIKTEVSVC